MNPLKLFFLCITFLFYNGISGQCEFINDTFTNDTILIPDSYKLENEVVLLKRIKTEILTKDDLVYQYYLYHEKILINSDEAIERNNKVYIPFRMNESLLTNKLRVIYSDGKIIELNKNDIKEETNEESGIQYQYYAIKGLGIGAMIEKLFIIQEYPDVKGTSVIFQDQRPIVQAQFELIYPNHLQFKSKSYNGFPTLEETKDAYEDKSNLHVSATNIPALPQDEKYSNEVSHLQMLRYKLYANLNNNSKNLNNYKDYASNVFNNLNQEPDKKMKKDLDNFIKKIPVTQDLFDQIRSIEQYVKTNIAYNKYFKENTNFIDALKNKQANDRDILELYSYIFNSFNIDYQYVVTVKRFQKHFDKDFDSMDQLEDVIFYFPKLNKYLEPNSFEYRFPLVNFNYTHTNGLFIKSTEFSGVKMGIGEVRFIDIPDNDLTHDYTNITIDLRDDIDNPVIHTTHQMAGYSALGYQYVKDYASDDQYEKFINEIAENFTQKGEIISLKVENDGCQNIGISPMILDMKFKGQDMIQKAGDNILLSVGELIGKQTELYQVEKRVLPVELFYTHRYTRSIHILLPDGYYVKNPEILNMHFETVMDNKIIALWDSKAEQKDHELIVSNTENYEVIDYQLDVFESYKKVLNAAADFNKIVIVLAKK